VDYRRMPIEAESPEQFGYERIRSNLAESSVADTPLRDLGVELDDLVLMYGDHLGRRGLRAAIAAAGRGLGPDDVLVTPGAAAALFIVHTTLLGPRDELVVVRPNYATNLETPRAIGAAVSHLDLRYKDGWAVDPDRLAELMTPRTKLVSVTNPHNPTGAVMPEAVLRRVVELVEAHPKARLLIDETYREMTFDGPLPLAATLSERAIGVSSLSKADGLPGIRMGWLMTRDAELLERFLAAKEQILITNSVVDEAIAEVAMVRRPERLPRIMTGIAPVSIRSGDGWPTRTSSSGWSRAAESWASPGSGPTPRSTSMRSTRSCSSVTGRSSGPGIGSVGPVATSGWATVGRPRRSSSRAWRRCWPRRSRPGTDRGPSGFPGSGLLSAMHCSRWIARSSATSRGSRRWSGPAARRLVYPARAG
jgi:histidinol-phosphate/aromatic aminotransferase/cobyric acid decarboxylase-like protein